MQRKFNFRLARVLRIREIEERVARAEWGAAQADLNRAQAKREERSQTLASSRQDMALGRLGGALAPGRTLLDERALDAQVFGLTNAMEHVHSKRVSANQMELAWRKREQDRKALLELEDRARDAHRVEQETGDNLEMDEQASGRRFRALRVERQLSSKKKDSENPSRSRLNRPNRGTAF
jgi:flagellar biosynthesis chaperone FliJ